MPSETALKSELSDLLSLLGNPLGNWPLFTVSPIVEIDGEFRCRLSPTANCPLQEEARYGTAQWGLMQALAMLGAKSEIIREPNEWAEDGYNNAMELRINPRMPGLPEQLTTLRALAAGKAFIHIFEGGIDIGRVMELCETPIFRTAAGKAPFEDYGVMERGGYEQFRAVDPTEHGMPALATTPVIWGFKSPLFGDGSLLYGFIIAGGITHLFGSDAGSRYFTRMPKAEKQRELHEEHHGHIVTGWRRGVSDEMIEQNNARVDLNGRVYVIPDFRPYENNPQWQNADYHIQQMWRGKGSKELTQSYAWTEADVTFGLQHVRGLVINRRWNPLHETGWELANKQGLFALRGLALRERAHQDNREEIEHFFPGTKRLPVFFLDSEIGIFREMHYEKKHVREAIDRYAAGDYGHCDIKELRLFEAAYANMPDEPEKTKAASRIR